MEYSVKTPSDVAEIVRNIMADTREGKHEITVIITIECGTIKRLDIT